MHAHPLPLSPNHLSAPGCFHCCSTTSSGPLTLEQQQQLLAEARERAEAAAGSGAQACAHACLPAVPCHCFQPLLAGCIGLSSHCCCCYRCSPPPAPPAAVSQAARVKALTERVHPPTVRCVCVRSRGMLPCQHLLLQLLLLPGEVQGLAALRA